VADNGYTVMGKNFPRIDAIGKVTGEAKYHAVDVRGKELPITPEKILGAFNESGIKSWPQEP